MPDFTPRDEISDWAIATSHTLMLARLHGGALFPVLNAAANPQALWEVLITVARSVASILRPHGHPAAPGPIGHRNMLVMGFVARTAPVRSLEEVEAIVLSAGQLIGCAADEDFSMCRALAAAVLSSGDPIGRGRLVLRAMLEILAVEPVDPQPKETP